jgi:lysozyme family protein
MSTEYTAAYEAALDHAMLYEVGGFWNLETPGVREGLIKTAAQRRAVGYVNDPLDRGGETKYGVAKNANMDLNITELDWDATKRVYFKRYWLAGDCQHLPSRLAVLHFDGCVNHGVGRAAKFLQRAVNATADGDIGPATLRAVASKNEMETCASICDQREAFYRTIVRNNPSQGRFLNGWLRRINEMRAFVLNPEKTFD